MGAILSSLIAIVLACLCIYLLPLILFVLVLITTENILLALITGIITGILVYFLTKD